jgi:hypothetical protein
MRSGKELNKILLFSNTSYVSILSLLLLLLLLFSSYSITVTYTALAFTPKTSVPNSNLSSSNASTMSLAAFVQTDKKSYLAGEDINIQGKINQIVPGQDKVRIDIYDPKGGIAIGDISETLDGKNTFIHTVVGSGWTQNFEPGRYKILVTYNRETVAQAVLIIVQKGQIPQ